MDPAIAEIVSAAFYGGKLRTEASREERARTDSAPFKQIAPLPTRPSSWWFSARELHRAGNTDGTFVADLAGTIQARWSLSPMFSAT